VNGLRHVFIGILIIIGSSGLCSRLFGETVPAATPKEINLGASCITSECHSDINKTKFLHGPVNFGECEPCHIAVGNRHEFQKRPEGNALCLICHEAEAPKKVVHPPFSVDCALCHNPHGLDNRYFVTGGVGAEGCQRCHSDVRKGLAFLHGPVAQGECLACHTPHQSDHKGLLTDAPADLCVACHIDFKARMEGAVSVHEPAQKGCEGCHGAHGGATRFFVTAQGRKLCEQCHGDFLKKVDQSKYPHKAMTEGKACENCHEPHASKQEKLLATNTETLCLACHNKTIDVDNRTIANVAAQIQDAEFLHGPVRQKNCIACHVGHGSNFPQILNKAFPAGFYAPFTDEAYALCFECHDKNLVLNEHSTITGFRNGDLNLHYVHVHREKGRSCRACHQEHASNQPLDIRDQVPFGRWIMQIKYTKTETGGTCMTGCHVPYGYDREHPVQYKLPPEQ
jgi:predicted CXXCH cytochrome family protein